MHDVRPFYESVSTSYIEPLDCARYDIGYTKKSIFNTEIRGRGTYMHKDRGKKGEKKLTHFFFT